MKSLPIPVYWLIALLVPVALILLAVRIVLNPWYLEFEYRTPGFPADPFGFSQQERLRYSKIALDYLVNPEGIDFLGEQRFPAGQQAPDFSCRFMEDCTLMYNERELEHMVDVKNVVQAALKVLSGSLALLAILGVWAGWQKRGRGALQALEQGGWLTLILIGLIVLFVLAAFGILFVFFHDVFFDEGTWTFYTSDTLIRLFPERFWRDTFLMVGSLTAGMGAALVLVSRAIRKNLAAREHRAAETA